MFSFKNIVLACLLITGSTARAQQVYDGWEFSMGAGYATYFGDLSPYAIRNLGDAGKLFRFLEFNKNYIETPSFHFGLEKKLSPSSGILFSANYSNIAMSDRYVNGKDDLKSDSRNFDRALNFRSDIFDLGAAYRISVPLRYRIIPSFWAGAGASYFTSYGDLYDADGNPYNYTGGNMEADQRYETKLRPLETEERYSNIAPYINAGIGLAFRVSEKVTIGWETDVRYSFSDYIDDVSGTYRTIYNSPEQMYAAMPGTNTAAPGENRGNNDGINDFYTQNRLVVKVGFSSFKKLAREKAARFKAPVIYPSYYPDFQNADSASNKDSITTSSPANTRLAHNNAMDSLKRRADSLQTALQQDSLQRRIKELENKLRQDSQRNGNPIYIQNTIIINGDSVSMPGSNGVNRNLGRRYMDSIVVNESYEVNWDSLRNTERVIQGNNVTPSDPDRSYAVQETYFTETEQEDFEMPPPGAEYRNTPATDTLNMQETRMLEQEAMQLRERNNAAAKDSLALVFEKEINQLRLRNDSIKLALLRQNIRTTDSLQQIRYLQGNTTPTQEQTRIRENYTAKFNELNRSIADLQRRNADLEASLRAHQGNYAPQPVNNDRYYRRLDNELNALNRQMSRNNRRFEPTIAPVVPIGGGNNRDTRQMENELQAIREELEAIKNQRSLRDSLLTDSGSTNEIIVDTVFQDNPMEQRRMDSMANMLNVLQQELSTLRNAQAAPVTTPVVTAPAKKTPETRTTSIYFDLGKTEISSDQFNKMRDLVGAIATASSIRLTACTDATGNQQVNERVSRQRANSVLNYLIRNFNISPDKISVDYETAEAGSGPNPLDRRVDIRIN